MTTGGNDSSESDESSHSPTIAVPEINIKKSPSKLNGEINLVIKGENELNSIMRNGLLQTIPQSFGVLSYRHFFLPLGIES